MSDKILLLHLVLVSLQPLWELLSRSRGAGKCPPEVPSATPVFCVGHLPCPVLLRDILEDEDANLEQVHAGEGSCVIIPSLLEGCTTQRRPGYSQQASASTALLLWVHHLSLPDSCSYGSKNLN